MNIDSLPTRFATPRFALHGLARPSFALLILLAVLVVPTPSVAESSATVLATQSGQQMHEHLQAMDRRLRAQLLAVADGRQGAESAEEIERLQRHLRSLEHRLQTWEEGVELIDKVRALQPLLDNLERAIEEPEVAEGTEPHRALRVEWPVPADQQLKGTPANDDCADATPIGNGTFFGDTTTATADGTGCYFDSPDVWFAYTSPMTGLVVADTFGSGFDTVLSVYTGCPGTFENEIACNDNVFGLQSAVGFQAQAGETYLIRVSGGFEATGPFTLNVGPGGAIAGTVIDDVTRDPVEGVELEIWNAGGGLVGNATTGPDGSYEVSGLVTGNHLVFTRFAQGYLEEVYDDVPCRDGLCDPFEGAAVVVFAGQTTEGIDFALNRAGSISGTVVERVTGTPPADFSVQVLLRDADDNDWGYTFVDSSGNYFLRGLAAGTYYVSTASREFQTEYYDDVPCPGGLFNGCQPSDVTPVEVSFGTTTGGIDFALERLGGISGTVTDTSGAPIVFASIEIYDENGIGVQSGFADESGFYQAEGLTPGNYFVKTAVPTYFDELYDDLPCESGCDPAAGSPIAVTLNAITPGIDFVLERLGSIAGTVTHAITGQPLSLIGVDFSDELGQGVGFSSTDSSGNYVFDRLMPGNYHAVALDREYVAELYEEMPCGINCDPTTGTPIAVSFDTVADGIDFTLDEKGSISGRFTDAVTGQTLETGNVNVYDVNGFFIHTGFADTSGNYVVTGIDPGTYFAVGGSSRYIDEVYDNIPCGLTCEPTSGMPITVNLNTVTEGIDFALDLQGTISGRVLHGGQPVTDAVIMTYRDTGELSESAFTDFEGRYVLNNVLPGTYFAVAQHHQFNDELYDNLPCEEGCDPTQGKPIVVNANSGVQGIDFDLGYCTPTATSLCLTGDRFRVEAVWEDFENEMGPAFADGLTPDAGTFWFFDPNNVEMVVKILDICDRPENRFWVFAAGLTNVGVDLKVTDELTGEMVNYSNPLGMTYETVLDTQAFATCDAGVGAVEPAVDPKEMLKASADISPGGLLSKGECLPGANTLCLNGGRFMVQATWLTPDVVGGLARAEPLTDETGYFWFGSADNVEVMVKVLDACGLPSFQNYWVFGAGLTNFEVTLRITDTESGEMQEYFNPQGRTFETVTDLGNFMTCP